MNHRAMIACLWESATKRLRPKTAAEPERRPHPNYPWTRVGSVEGFRRGCAASLMFVLATNLANTPAQPGAVPTGVTNPRDGNDPDAGVEEIRRHFERGQALFEQEEFRAAEKSFHRALKAADQLGNPTMRHALLANLGMTHSAHAEQLGHSQERTDELEHAIAFYEQIIAEESALPQHNCEAFLAAQRELGELKAQLGQATIAQPGNPTTHAVKVPEPRLKQHPSESTNTDFKQRQRPRQRLPKRRQLSLSLGITGAVLAVAASASLTGGLIYLRRAESLATKTLEEGATFKLGRHTRMPPTNSDQEGQWRSFIDSEIPEARGYWRAVSFPIIGTGLALWLTGILLKPRAKSAKSGKKATSSGVSKRLWPEFRYGRRQLGLRLKF